MAWIDESANGELVPRPYWPVERKRERSVLLVPNKSAAFAVLYTKALVPECVPIIIVFVEPALNCIRLFAETVSAISKSYTPLDALFALIDATPVLSTEKSVVVEVWVEEPMAKRVVLVEPLFAWIDERA